MNRSLQIYLPFVVVAAVLLWLVWKHWPSGRPRADELDRVLDEMQRPAR